MKSANVKYQRAKKVLASLLSLLLAFAMTPSAAFAVEGGSITAGVASSDLFAGEAGDNDGSEASAGESDDSEIAEAATPAAVTAGEAGENDGSKAAAGDTGKGDNAAGNRGVPYDYPVGAIEQTEWEEANPVIVGEPEDASGADAPAAPESAPDTSANSFATQEDETLTYGNWKYKLIDGGAGVLGYTGNVSTLEIPRTLNSTKVISVLFDSSTSANDRSSVWGNASTIKLNENIVTIGGDAFYSCKSLTYVDMSSAPLTYIGRYAFVNTGITSMTLPETLVDPDYEAFDGMYNLQDLYFNANLKEFSQVVPIIAGSDSWTVTQYKNPVARSPQVIYHVPSNSANYKVQNGVLYSKDGSILYSRPIGMAGSHFTVPSSVRHIAEYAFFGTENLKTITLNNGLETIGSSAFSLSSLTSVTIPGTVQRIDNYAFSRSRSLASVYFEDGLTDLWNGGASEQFFGCTALRSVRLPETLTRVGNAAFAETALTTLDIPASVTSINYGAFGDIYTLTTITGGEGLKRINNLAFRNAAISSFPFGDNLEMVSGSAFYKCTNYPNPDYPSYLSRNEAGDYVSSIASVFVSGAENYDYAYEVLAKVNAERSKVGLAPLTMDAELQKAAMQRASELIVLFSHTRPSGASCTTASSKMSGENIAAGQSTPDAVMNSWMNSAGHKGNILGSSYKSIGVGCYIQNGLCMWVQVFGTSQATIALRPANATVEHAIELDVNSQQSQAIEFRATCNLSRPNPGNTAQLSVYSGGSSTFRGFILAKSFDWDTSNPNVATVDDMARVSAKAVGRSTISARVKGTRLGCDYVFNVYANDSGSGSGGSGGYGSGSGSGGSWSGGSSGSGKTSGSVAMHRLYNRWSGEHFYTGSVSERDGLIKVGWTYEGVGWYAPQSGGTNVHRLYNRWTGDHHFTTSASERDSCVKAGWTYEGVGWKSGGTKPVYREYNPYARAFYHNYTASVNEHTKLCSVGWRSEGVGWYGV